ncbi:MAG: cytidine deaminase [Clostridiales bacterium]|nr:cytidine deaminase [Clostridiales bacterium]
MIELSLETAGAPEGVERLMNRVADAALAREGVGPCDAFVRAIDDEAMRLLNRRTRGVDATTDVLSFPSARYRRGTARDCPAALRREVDPSTGRPFLGDIAISLPRAARQAAEYGHSLEREIGFLTAHAMLHLLGYDHIQPSDRAKMRAMEDAIMDDLRLYREEPMSDDRLFELACRAMERAYAPYSNFKVGACLLTGDGRTFTGANIENASYGATICAERAAIARAVSDGATGFVAVAVAAERGAAWPCGICRQVLNEFSRDMRVLVGRAGEGYRAMALSALLPESFGPADLSKEDK